MHNTARILRALQKHNMASTNLFQIHHKPQHKLKRLTKIVKETALGDNISVTVNGEGKVQYVREDPFWELEENLDVLLNNAN